MKNHLSAPTNGVYKSVFGRKRSYAFIFLLRVINLRVLLSRAFLSFLFISSIQFSAQVPTYQWAKNIGSSGVSSRGREIVTDPAGNCYVTGFFSGTCDFDPGSSVVNLTSAGAIDIFLAKYTSNGNYMWAKRMGGTSTDDGVTLKLDGSGNIFLLGRFYSTADLDPGTGTANFPSNGADDIFFAKYDSNGNYLWAKTIGGSSTDAPEDLVLDASGNIYITGRFFSTVDFDPGLGSAPLNAGSSGSDIFFAKYDASGNYIWARNIGSTQSDYGNGIAVDANGNVYITGNFNLTADFDPGTAVVTLTSAGAQDIFLAKYNSAGNYLWAKNFGSTGNDKGQCITLDASGNIYVGGDYSQTVDFDPSSNVINKTSAGGWDLFLAKYDSNATYLWVNAIGGPGDEEVNDIALDANGNPHIVGYFGQTVDFDPGLGTATLAAANSGSVDIFFAAYSNSASYLWSGGIGNIGHDHGNSIALRNGSVWITGLFINTADFDIDTGTANLTAIGSVDIFIAKYGAGCNVSASASNNLICKGSSVTLSTTATSSISWSTGGTSPTVVVTPTSSTAYTVSGTATSGTTTCTQTIVLTVSVNPLPVIATAVTPSMLCTGATATISASGANSYSWNTGQVTANATVNPITTAIYTVTGTNTQSCTAAQTVMVNVSNCTGLYKNDLENRMVVFPNPTSGDCTLQFDKTYIGEIKVFDVVGALIKRLTVDSSNVSIDLSAEKDGLYFIYIGNKENGNGAFKIIKRE